MDARRTARIFAYCVVCGLVVSVAGLNQGPAAAAWWWLDGIVLAAAFVPAVRWCGAHGWKLFGILWPAVTLVGAFLTWTEALIFVSSSRREQAVSLIGGMVLYTLLALALAFLASPFRLPAVAGLPQSLDEPRPTPRRFSGLALGVAAGGLVYLVLYFVFGGIFYQLFTRPYYENPALPLHEGTKVVARLGWWFPLIQVGRGMLMSVSVVPLARHFRRSRGMLAVTLGSVLWIVGGLAPLLMPKPFMPPMLRLYHIFEILFQNAGLGLALGYLLRPRSTGKSIPH